MIQYDDKTVPGKSLGLYLHIPFCIRKCNYCDFLSFGEIGKEQKKEYIRALNQEIGLYGERYGNKYYVDTIFIGGGTPSLIDESLIRDMMAAVRESFPIAESAEISIEANPKTLTEQKLAAYIEAGINRISIGVQSLDDKVLESLGRIHSKEDFLYNYSLARECGFRNINVDLMFAVPGQTMKIWQDTLEQVIALDPEHLSFYSLQIEEGTPFNAMLQDGRIREIEDQLDRDMYHYAVHKMESAGYQHYEISNAAREGFSCRHNLKYWSMEDYLGLGLGSHSFVEGVRFSNTADFTEYLHIDADKFDQRSPFISWSHKNTREDDISEYLFTGLRKRKGIELYEFQNKFGVTLERIHGDALTKSIGNGLIEIQDGFLRFTEKGLDVANTVLVEFV